MGCKRQYKAAVREQKRRKKDVCVNKLESAFTAGDDADFWKCFNCECRVNYRHSYYESIKPNDFVNVFKDNFVVSEENISAHDAFNEVMRG